METTFRENVLDQRGIYPLARDVKLDDIVEINIYHPFDGKFKHVGYVTKIDESAINLSSIHRENDELRLDKEFSLRMITEYRVLG